MNHTMKFDRRFSQTQGNYILNAVTNPKFDERSKKLKFVQKLTLYAKC